MKFVIFTVLFVGVNFAKAALDVGGTVVGSVTITPYLTQGAVATRYAADEVSALATALDGTTSCGASGSNQEVTDVTQSVTDLARAFDGVTTAVNNYLTNDQFKILYLDGNLNPVSIALKNLANKMNAFGTKVSTLTENIDTVSWSGANQLAASVDQLTQSTNNLNALFSSVTFIPSGLFLITGSNITGFTAATNKLAQAFLALSQSTATAETECEMSTNLPTSLKTFSETANKFYRTLSLL